QKSREDCTSAQVSLLLWTLSGHGLDQIPNRAGAVRELGGRGVLQSRPFSQPGPSPSSDGAPGSGLPRAPAGIAAASESSGIACVVPGKRVAVVGTVVSHGPVPDQRQDRLRSAGTGGPDREPPVGGLPFRLGDDHRITLARWVLGIDEVVAVVIHAIAAVLG